MENAHEHYQVIIIGGGIQGCATAEACARAGLSTLLIEKNTWGWATSSRSSKLIHGGLRYLQTAQFRLVRECLGERDWMLANLPDLVERNWFYIPIYRTSHYRRWQIRAGLMLYYLLSGFQSIGRFRSVPRSEWSSLSGISQQGLQAVFAYQDAQTDDLELTRRFQQQAASHGARCLDHTELSRAVRHNGRFDVSLQSGDETSRMTADILVNAAGPWVNQVLRRVEPAPEPVAVDLVQGAHIVIDEQVSQECFYLEAPQDHRAVFVLPWHGKTLIGTTETAFDGEPENCVPLPSEITYLLDTVTHYFPDRAFNIVDQWAGLRVLPRSHQRAFVRSREVMISDSAGVLSIYGGKLTACRVTAATVCRRVQSHLGL